MERMRIAIIGGGAAGTIVARELTRVGADVEVDIYERRGDGGPGLAYSTTDARHVVNVPAGKLSAVADDPDHLVRWLEANGEEARPESFPQRQVYGRYLRELLAECDARIITAPVTGLTSNDAVELTTDDGTSAYDAAVIALGNVDAPPAIPLPDDPRCFASPWATGALDAGDLPGDATVLIVGTGLTAVDAALSFADLLPDAHLVMASRNGHLPFAHLPGPLRTPAPHDGFRTDCRTLDELVDEWTAHLARAEAAGFDWRDAVDGIRPITQQLWRALDEGEQARFLRERRRWWEARRNRAAPSVGARLDELIASGRLEVVASGISELDAREDGVHVELAGTKRRFDRVVSATGPTADIRRTTNPLLAQLLGDGIVAADAHHLGIRTGDDGAIIDSSGSASERLYTLGWLRRGELWETLAIPEIRVQATVIAQALTARLASAAHR